MFARDSAASAPQSNTLLSGIKAKLSKFMTLRQHRGQERAHAPDTRLNSSDTVRIPQQLFADAFLNSSGNKIGGLGTSS